MFVQLRSSSLQGRELYNNLDTTFYHENLNGEYTRTDTFTTNLSNKPVLCEIKSFLHF